MPRTSAANDGPTDVTTFTIPRHESELGAAALNMSREGFLYHTFVTTNTQCNTIIVQAAILHLAPYGGPSDHPFARILLYKRRPDSIYDANSFEMPSDKMGLADATVRDALMRVVREKTGLNVSRVIDARHTMGVTNITQAGQQVIATEARIALTFVVLVGGDMQFRITSNEHVQGLWASKPSVEQLQIADWKKTLVLDVLEKFRFVRA